ncbi:MAG: hypothetical protein IT308_00615 [Anaerolineaceae bacterium]|nr:hypothetical protein [Anaerolineaceae bacterium]
MPIPPQFRTQTELVNYLEILEQRIETLETENKEYKEAFSMPSGADVPVQAQKWLEKLLPQTNLLNHSFISRAFTVWGYYFAAQLIISAGALAVYLIVRVVLLVSGR